MNLLKRVRGLKPERRRRVAVSLHFHRWTRIRSAFSPFTERMMMAFFSFLALGLCLSLLLWSCRIMKSLLRFISCLRASIYNQKRVVNARCHVTHFPLSKTLTLTKINHLLAVRFDLWCVNSRGPLRMFVSRSGPMNSFRVWIERLTGSCYLEIVVSLILNVVYRQRNIRYQLIEMVTYHMSSFLNNYSKSNFDVAKEWVLLKSLVGYRARVWYFILKIVPCTF